MIPISNNDSYNLHSNISISVQSLHNCLGGTQISYANLIAGTYTYSSATPLLCHAFLGPPLTHYGEAGWGLVTGWWNTADKVLPPAQAAHTTSHPRQISELDEGLSCVWLGHKQTDVKL